MTAGGWESERRKALQIDEYLMLGSIPTRIQRICCISAGYVGGSDHGADRCSEVGVQVVDINQARIDAWNNADLGKFPEY